MMATAQDHGVIDGIAAQHTPMQPWPVHCCCPTNPGQHVERRIARTQTALQELGLWHTSCPSTCSRPATCLKAERNHAQPVQPGSTISRLLCCLCLLSARPPGGIQGTTEPLVSDTCSWHERRHAPSLHLKTSTQKARHGCFAGLLLRVH